MTEESKTESAEKDLSAIEKDLVKKTEEAAQNYDQMLRARADLENFRKRTEKATVEAMLFAQASILERLLPIWDQLTAGVKQIESVKEADPKVKEGFSLVLKNMDQLFSACGVTRVAADTGKPYDPQFHEVIRAVESDESDGNIVSVEQEGFLVAGRVLRTAKVVVTKKKK